MFVEASFIILHAEVEGNNIGVKIDKLSQRNQLKESD